MRSLSGNSSSLMRELELSVRFDLSFLHSWSGILAVKEYVLVDFFESFVEGALFLIEVGMRMFGVEGLPFVGFRLVSTNWPVSSVH